MYIKLAQVEAQQKIVIVVKFLVTSTSQQTGAIFAEYASEPVNEAPTMYCAFMQLLLLLLLYAVRALRTRLVLSRA